MKEPKIRFKGFQGEWEETPFSEIVNRTSASASSSLYPGVEFEDINSGEGTLNKDVRRKKIVKTGTQFSKGDVLFGKLRPYLKNILLADFKGVAIGDFWVLKPQKVTSELLYILLNSREFMRIANISSGSKMPRADWNLVSYSPFTFPNAKEEQLSLGAYFQHLDSLIQSTTKKIESLKQVKAASLQSMFPQEGETTPRVRFKGFEGEWEKVKLGDIAILNPKSELPESFEYVDLESVIGTTMKSHRRIERNCAPSRAQRLAKYDDIFYQTVRPYQKNNYHFKLYYNDFVFSSGYAQIRALKDSSYLFTVIQSNSFLKQVMNNCTGTSFPAISPSMLKELFIYDCDKEEQKMIGEYFTNLDRQISLQTQRLEKLKQIKSACLDNMFV